MTIIQQEGEIYRVTMTQDELDALCGACCVAMEVHDRGTWKVLFDEMKIFDTDFKEKKNEQV